MELPTSLNLRRRHRTWSLSVSHACISSKRACSGQVCDAPVTEGHVGWEGERGREAHDAQDLSASHSTASASCPSTSMSARDASTRRARMHARTHALGARLLTRAVPPGGEKTQAAVVLRQVLSIQWVGRHGLQHTSQSHRTARRPHQSN
eukprot:2632820-Rhodomonas_salina.3